MNRGMMVMVGIMMLVVGTGLAADPPEKAPGGKPGQPALPACPVMGESIDLSVSLRTDDGPVFFCCPACIKKYQAEPAKFAEKVAVQRKALVDLPKVQVTCPLSGNPVDAKTFTEKDGKKVYFCCAGCKPKYEAEAAKYAGALANSYTYQTQCPVTEKAINPQAFIELTDGRKIYFCSKDCSEKFVKEPAPYLPNLEKQSVHLKAEEVKVKK